MKYFSINDYVKIKLNETGITILKNIHKESLKSYPNASLGEFKTPVVDENGYTEMQICDVMNIFGNYFIPGNSNLPFDTIIAISEDYLKNSEKGKSL